MGSGIAEVCARNGLKTIVTDAGSDQVMAGQRRVEFSLRRGREGGKLSDEDVERISGLLRYTTDLGDFESCDVCIEAVVGHLPEKKVIFERLDKITPPHAILASNTSSLPIIEIARATTRPDVRRTCSGP